MRDEGQKKLEAELRSIRARLKRLRNRRLGETNTKASLIEPLLHALGWDTLDPDEVNREYKSNRKDSPVDYALLVLRKPRLFLEAKGLGENLSDRKWVRQMLGYAVTAGVEWCILTDGAEYRLYNATAPVDADEKLFRIIRVDDPDEQAAPSVLRLLAKDKMADNLLNVLWSAYFVDRQIQNVLVEMFTSADPSLVRLLRKRTRNLKGREIVEAVRRCDIHFEFPAKIDPDRVESGGGRRTPSKLRIARGRGTKKKHVGVSLANVIAAGLLKPPLELVKRYKGRDLTAKLNPDGTVTFQGTIYKSASTAAEFARGTITGRRMTTNGWTFWQYEDKRGTRVYLDAMRQKFIRRRTAT